MDFQSLKEITAIVMILTMASFCIYQYVAQNKKYSEK